MAKRVLPFLFVLFFGISCLDEPDCIGLNNNIIGFSFVSLNEEVGDTITIEGLSIDGVAYQTGKVTVTSFSLPLNYANSATTFALQLDTGFYDRDTTIILNMSYLSQAQYVSEDCGERFVLSELAVTSPSLDEDEYKVISDKPGTSTNKTNNIELYFFQ